MLFSVYFICHRVSARNIEIKNPKHVFDSRQTYNLLLGDLGLRLLLAVR